MPLNRLVIYARDVEATALFYEKHFGFQRMQLPGDRILELVPANGGATLLLHPAAKSQRAGGQSVVKLVFDVEDVAAFCARSAANGLAFGPIHQADGYAFANAEDPCQNAIQVSSRAFLKSRTQGN